MLRAHRQAWCWQDEYHGLGISDIRALELETQRALEEKMMRFREAEAAEHARSDRIDHTLDEGEPVRSSSRQGDVNVESLKGDLLDSSSAKHISWGNSRIRNEQQHSGWKVESLEKLRDSSSDDEYFDAKGEH